MPWTNVYAWGFANAGTWREVDPTTGAIGNPITVVDDGGDMAGQALKYLVFEAQTKVTIDPTRIYRVAIRARQKTAPSSGGVVYFGVTGIDAVGNRCNINGSDTLSSQAYCVLRAANLTASQVTYYGYIHGRRSPGDGGANSDIATPMRLHSDVAQVRPLTYLLFNSTDGEQLVADYVIARLDCNLSLTAFSGIGPYPEAWPVYLLPSTNGVVGTEYEAYRIWRGSESLTFLTGQLPGAYVSHQPAGQTIPWKVELYREIRGVWTPLFSVTQNVTTPPLQNRTLVVNSSAGGSNAYCEIQSWTSEDYTRRSSVLQVPGRYDPIVLADDANMPSATIVFLTRTTGDLDRLVNTLRSSDPTRIIPNCPTIKPVWVMVQDFTVSRLTNDALDARRLTECRVQYIVGPPPPTTLLSSDIPTLVPAAEAEPLEIQDLGEEEAPE